MRIAARILLVEEAQTIAFEFDFDSRLLESRRGRNGQKKNSWGTISCLSSLSRSGQALSG
jgi:hypothetical protein